MPLKSADLIRVRDACQEYIDSIQHDIAKMSQTTALDVFRVVMGKGPDVRASVEVLEKGALANSTVEQLIRSLNIIIRRAESLERKER